MYRWFAALSVFGVLAVAAGCGADHAGGLDVTPSTGGSGGEGGSSLPPPPPPPPTDCVTGDVIECSEYYLVGDYQNCFVGVQVCVDNDWEACATEDEVAKRLLELGLGAGGAGGAGGVSP